MSNFDQFFSVGGRPIVISTTSPGAIGVQLACYDQSTYTITSKAHSVANTAIYIPFTISEAMTVYKLALLNGSTVSGNIDLGIYNEAGAKQVSSGSAAQSGTSALQAIDTVDTFLVPGRYYMAMAMDNTTGTYLSPFWTGSPYQHLKLYGMAEQVTAFPLPSTATLAAVTSANVPLIGVFGRTLAA